MKKLTKRDTWKAIGKALARQRCSGTFWWCEYSDKKKLTGGTCPVCRAKALLKAERTRKTKEGA